MVALISLNKNSKGDWTIETPTPSFLCYQVIRMNPAGYFSCRKVIKEFLCQDSRIKYKNNSPPSRNCQQHFLVGNRVNYSLAPGFECIYK